MFAPGIPRSVLVVSPAPSRIRDIVVVAHAAAHVHDQPRAEDARPVGRRADGLVRAGAAEAGVGRSAVDAVEARIEDLRTLEAEAIGDLVRGVQAVVELRVEAVGRLLAHLRLLVVVLPERRAGDVRGWHVRENRAGDRADPLRRDDVVRKRDTARAVGGARQRVVDLRRGCGEITRRASPAWAPPHGRRTRGCRSSAGSRRRRTACCG